VTEEAQEGVYKMTDKGVSIMWAEEVIVVVLALARTPPR
jgi:hypothetical protein